ncbi:unnamed protein product [Phytophthora fragariaefolia]|uniref:Unnamed protein product n=1 Tax=Phytophthora fragariaefolia TaxID=1490495 RepID=A0A9W7CRX6_9STRA|nr:unnamed protein product [Phytophthora fragariaefolia]
MLKAESAAAYSAYRQDILRSLGYDKKYSFFEYFEVNWETCKEEWVNYHRDNVPHLNNHPNNRIGSDWGKIKQVVQRDDPIDELIGTLIMLQEWSDEGYMKEFRSFGTQQTPIAEDAADAELLTLAVQLSPHAYRLVRGQYKFACSAETAYEVKVEGTRVELRVSSEGGERTLLGINIGVSLLYCSIAFGGSGTIWYLTLACFVSPVRFCTFCIVLYRIASRGIDFPVQLRVHVDAATMQTRDLLPANSSVRIRYPPLPSSTLLAGRCFLQQTTSQRGILT